MVLVWLVSIVASSSRLIRDTERDAVMPQYHRWRMGERRNSRHLEVRATLWFQHCVRQRKRVAMGGRGAFGRRELVFWGGVV